VKIVAALTAALTASLSGGSVRALVRLVVVLFGSILLFTVGFQLVMAIEGREFSWWSGVYWTVVTMTTLGFGDIVFESDLGRMYSVVVLLAGAILVLVLLPFTFIQLVYLPLRTAAREARAPRQLPVGTSGHVLLMGRSSMEQVLMRRVRHAGIPYTLIVEDVEEAIALHDQDYPVMVGLLDDPETFRAARAEDAALVVTMRSDQANTNITFTLREVTDSVTVVATATSADSVDVLELAGCDHVVQLGQLLGTAFARRILAPTARSSVVATFDDLVIAETSAAGTELAGRRLDELDLQTRFGVSVVGVWERGSLQAAHADTRVGESSILLLAGGREQLEAYDSAAKHFDDGPSEDAAERRSGDADARVEDGRGSTDEDADDEQGPDPGTATEAQEAADDGQLVLVLGGGRVGRATVASLHEAGIPYRIVDQREERIAHLDGAVVGDAADIEVLRAAGIDEASAIVITTHEDDTNIYLTLYCRRLRPDVEILGRVNIDRNVSTMHRAGADLVLSYASTGAMEAWNALRHHRTMLLAEGLVVFRLPVPAELARRRLDEVDVRGETGCTVVGVAVEGSCDTDLDGATRPAADAELILIGDTAAEERFLARYVAERPASGWSRWWQRLRPGSYASR
jgi:voltage-gated potassium channel